MNSSDAPRPRILIVDDEPIIVRNMQYIFNQCGFDSEGCSKIADALNLVRQGRFDLLITDIRLPDGSGVDLIREVHRLEPRTRFLIHTGAHEFTLTAELRECGLKESDIFLKPVPSVWALAERLYREVVPRSQA